MPPVRRDDRWQAERATAMRLLTEQLVAASPCDAERLADVAAQAIVEAASAIGTAADGALLVIRPIYAGPILRVVFPDLGMGVAPRLTTGSNGVDSVVRAPPCWGLSRFCVVYGAKWECPLPGWRTMKFAGMAELADGG